MDSSEIACYVRARELNRLDLKKFLRWMTAMILNLWSKKSIQPTDLMKFDGEDAYVQKVDVEKKKKLDEVFSKWDKANN